MTPVPGGTRGHDVPLGSEVLVVVGLHRVLVDPAVAAILLGQVGHREDEDAAGVVGRHVLVNIGPGAVLDLDAGDVLLDLVAADDDILRLADVDSRVRSTTHDALLDQDISTEHGVESVSAVGLRGAAGPLGPDVPDDESLRAAHLHGVSLGVLDGQMLERDVRLARQQQSFASGALSLVLEAQDRLVGPLALDRHGADVERERRGELELARAELDDLAGLGLDQRGLGLLRCVRSGLDPGDLLGTRSRGRLGVRGCARLVGAAGKPGRDRQKQRRHTEDSQESSP